jgi:hypothetical protein
MVCNEKSIKNTTLQKKKIINYPLGLSSKINRIKYFIYFRDEVNETLFR